MNDCNYKYGSFSNSRILTFYADKDNTTNYAYNYGHIVENSDSIEVKVITERKEVYIKTIQEGEKIKENYKHFPSKHFYRASNAEFPLDNFGKVDFSELEKDLICYNRGSKKNRNENKYLGQFLKHERQISNRAEGIECIMQVLKTLKNIDPKITQVRIVTFKWMCSLEFTWIKNSFTCCKTGLKNVSYFSTLPKEIYFQIFRLSITGSLYEFQAAKLLSFFPQSLMEVFERK